MESRTKGSEQHSQQSLSGLVTDLRDEVTSLVRNEVQLAKAEMSQKVTQAEKGAGAMAVAAILGMAALMVLLASAVLGLGLWMDLWLSALIVGAVVAVVAFGAYKSGKRKLKAQNLKPQATTESLKRDKEFAKERLQ